MVKFWSEVSSKTNLLILCLRTLGLLWEKIKWRPIPSLIGWQMDWRKILCIQISFICSIGQRFFCVKVSLFCHGKAIFLKAPTAAALAFVKKLYKEQANYGSRKYGHIDKYKHVGKQILWWKYFSQRGYVKVALGSRESKSTEVLSCNLTERNNAPVSKYSTWCTTRSK